jgi:signal transduction histidine kinase
MARETQRLQVIVIVSGMLNVVLIVTTFLGFRSANELTKRSADAQKRADQAEAAQRQVSSQLQFLQYMVGASTQSLEALKQAGLQMTDEMQKIEQQFRQDMLQYGEGLPQEQQNYRTVCANLVATIRQKNEALASADNRVKQTLQELNAKVTELTQRLAAAENAKKQAEDTLAQEIKKFNDERQRFVQKLQEDSQKINDLTQQLSQLQQDFQKREKSLLSTIEAQETRLASLQREVRQLTQQTFEVPDGRIVAANQLERYVWINLGSAHGLRPQMLFGVYDAETTNVQYAKPKGSIEVTRVQNANLAEARIVTDDPRNPILKNDLIYSPVWRGGAKVQFALAGFMDINNDGVSDRELIKHFILSNNGQIDAEVTDSGQLVGKVTPGTRYLVLGEPPTEKDSQEYLANYSALQEESRKLGVEIVRVQDLLESMKWKPSIQTHHFLDSSVRPASGQFTPRQPPSRGANGGAY